jgi:peptidoglycan DL-endopeptidase CwlO
MSDARGQARGLRTPPPRAVSALVLLALTLLAVGGATTAQADTLAQKRAQASAAASRLTQLQVAAEKRIEAYDAVHQRYRQTVQAIRLNRASLRIARANLAVARRRLSESLTATYKEGNADAVAYLLAAQSIGDLVDQVQVMQRANGVNASLLSQVVRYQGEVGRRQALLAKQLKVVSKQQASAAAAKARVLAGLRAEQRYYANLKASIRNLIAARQAAAAAAADRMASTPTNLPAPPASTLGGQAVAIAEQYLGVPYQWGGASPSTGFDCSGLVMYVYAQLGVSLPHNAAAQYAALPHVPASDLQPGDLVFFYGLGHVGIYIGNGLFIHAPHTGDVVRISALSAEGSYDGAARVPG